MEDLLINFFTKKEDIGFQIKEEKIINLGKAQIFMNISSSENSNGN
jgi:hypothetical protein